MNNLETNLAKAQSQYNTFLETSHSIMLATTSLEGDPNASYAPFIIDEEKNFYIYISNVSTHTQNIIQTKKASILVIEDEAKSSQIFARRRLSFECIASKITEETADWDILVNAFSKKFGAIIEHFKGMADFILIKLKPNKGRFVIGFGMAYDILPSNLNQLVAVSGTGHQTKVASAVLSEAAINSAIEHINNEHADSVLSILRVYGGVSECSNAKIVSMTDKDFQVNTLQNGMNKTFIIPFPKKLQTTGDLHTVFVEMSKKSKSVLQQGG